MKKFILSILLALTLLSQLLSPALAAETAEVVGTFSDVVSTDWFFKYVSELSTNKVLNGYPEAPLSLKTQLHTARRSSS